MIEQEYINVQELTNINRALDCLRDICQENSPVIKKNEWLLVNRQLQSWMNRLYEINIKEKA